MTLVGSVCACVATLTWLVLIGLWCLSSQMTPRHAELVDYTSATVSVDSNQTQFPAVPASFGGVLPVIDSGEPLSGELVFVEGLACREPPPLDGIAVVLRGECPFYAKVANLEAAGARAVIVGNTNPDELLDMYAPGSEDYIQIPSVFVSGRTFLALHEHKTANLYIHQASLGILSSVALFILSPLLSFLLIYAILVVQRYSRRLQQRASKRVVNALPVRTWVDADERAFGVCECAICLEQFDKYSHVLSLPCAHEFHEGCVRRWLLQYQRTCPICKSLIEG